MSSITEFKGGYRFLSNFYPCVIKGVGGMVFNSVEHGFQAAKTLDVDSQVKIWQAATPGDAKRLGRRVTLRQDWELIKLAVMLDLVRQKFAEPTLRRQLLATLDAELVEGNWWNDTFWGVCRGKGENHLGKILMQVRYEIVTGKV